MPVLSSGQNTNLKVENMVILHFIGITIDYKNYPTPENVSSHKQQQQQGKEQQDDKVCKFELNLFP